MNIAFTHAGFPGGGSERITADIARYLNGFEGHYKVYVFTSHIYTELMTPFYIDNVNVVHLPNTSAKEFIKQIRLYNIDILVQSSFPIKHIRKIRKATGIKVIFTSHEEPFWRKYITRQRGVFKRLAYALTPKPLKAALLYRLAVRWTLKAYQDSDAFTVLCDEYKEIIRKQLRLGHDNHITAIENPEYLVENINYNKQKIILYSGRLDQMSKRVDRLLRVWHKTQHQLPDWKLIISGDGPDKEFLHSLAKELRLDRCEFIGRQTDMRQWYDKASIVCLTSRTEGWPLCLTEAQAHGCIAIAFGCTAGVVNILSEDQGNVCGFVIPPYDEDAYARALVQIAGLSPDEQERIRKNAVRKRARYIPENIAEKWRQLFESL